MDFVDVSRLNLSPNDSHASGSTTTPRPGRCSRTQQTVGRLHSVLHSRSRCRSVEKTAPIFGGWRRRLSNLWRSDVVFSLDGVRLERRGLSALFVEGVGDSDGGGVVGGFCVGSGCVLGFGEAGGGEFMNFDAATLEPAFAHLADGAFGVVIRSDADRVFVERVDPVLTIDEVAEWLGWKASTVRSMEKKGLLHAMRSKGRSGSLGFGESRVVADAKRMEDF